MPISISDLRAKRAFYEIKSLVAESIEENVKLSLRFPEGAEVEFFDVEGNHHTGTVEEVKNGIVKVCSQGLLYEVWPDEDRLTRRREEK